MFSDHNVIKLGFISKKIIYNNPICLDILNISNNFLYDVNCIFYVVVYVTYVLYVTCG